MQLPGLVQRMPWMVRWLESRPADAPGQQEFRWRLDCATAVAEASTQGARRFLGLGEGSGLLRAGAGLAAAVAGEAFWRASAVLARPWLRRL